MAPGPFGPQARLRVHRVAVHKDTPISGVLSVRVLGLVWWDVAVIGPLRVSVQACISILLLFVSYVVHMHMKPFVSKQCVPACLSLPCLSFPCLALPCFALLCLVCLPPADQLLFWPGTCLKSSWPPHGTRPPVAGPQLDVCHSGWLPPSTRHRPRNLARAQQHREHVSPGRV